MKQFYWILTLLSLILVLSGCADGRVAANSTPAPLPATPTPAQAATQTPPSEAAAQATPAPEAVATATAPAEEEASATATGVETPADAQAPVNEAELIDTGKQIYARNCAACHQLNGKGNNIYPALNGSEVVNNPDPSEAINVVVHGRKQMPPFGKILSAEEIAAVLSYIRNAWDNKAPVVSVEQVEQAMQGNP